MRLNLVRRQSYEMDALVRRGRPSTKIPTMLLPKSENCVVDSRKRLRRPSDDAGTCSHAVSRAHW